MFFKKRFGSSSYSGFKPRYGGGGGFKPRFGGGGFKPRFGGGGFKSRYSSGFKPRFGGGGFKPRFGGGSRFIKRY